MIKLILFNLILILFLNHLAPVFAQQISTGDSTSNSQVQNEVNKTIIKCCEESPKPSPTPSPNPALEPSPSLNPTSTPSPSSSPAAPSGDQSQGGGGGTGSAAAQTAQEEVKGISVLAPTSSFIGTFQKILASALGLELITYGLYIRKVLFKKWPLS